MKILTRIKNILVPLSFGVVFLLLWEGAVRVFDLKPYFLAAPSKIFEQFTKIRAEFGMRLLFLARMLLLV